MPSHRGAQTREGILRKALHRAVVVGLEGLSIGGLAQDVGMSKSGLFAHFGSKEDLQISVLDYAAERFVSHIVRPALQEPRGEPRVVAMFARWLDWAARGVDGGGCVFASTAWEFDDREGPVRDRVTALVGDWVNTLARAAEISVAEGHFRADLDCPGFAQNLHGQLLAFHLHARLFRDALADQRAQHGFAVLLDQARARRLSDG